MVILTPHAKADILALLLSSDRCFQIVPGSSSLDAQAESAAGNTFVDVAANTVVTGKHFEVVGRYQRRGPGAVVTLRQGLV